MKTSTALVALFVSAILAPLAAETRTFIDQTGRSLQGELVSTNGDMVTIKRTTDGVVFTVKAANFSKADQAYFASKGGTATAAAAATPATATTVKLAPAAAPVTADNRPLRIEAKVYPNKSDRPTNIYFDERTARVGFKVDVRNGEQQRGLTGGKATMMAFAKNLEDGQESKVISREDFDVNLEPLKSMTHETKEVKLSYDNIAFKYGFKYSGYLLVVKDGAGKTITVVGSSPTVEKFADAALKLATDDIFDKAYAKVDQ